MVVVVLEYDALILTEDCGQAVRQSKICISQKTQRSFRFKIAKIHYAAFYFCKLDC